MEDNIKKIMHADNYKQKMNTYDYNIKKKHWNTIKRPNLRIHWVKKGAKI
jgi:hypothetical protein